MNEYVLEIKNLSKSFGKNHVLKGINLKVKPGKVIGLMGENGAGKSTFLKLLSHEIESTTGEVILDKNERMSVLRQDQNAYNEYTVINTVLHGHKRLMEIMEEKEVYYSKADFTDEDGIRLAELEGEFADMGGWEAESDAENLLQGLGVESFMSM